MIWLSAVSLVAGGVLAWHFKIIVLAPATFVIAAIAIIAGQMQITGIPSIILIIGIASAGAQIGYFLAMLFQHVMGATMLRSSSLSSNKTTGRPPSISGTPIS
ncbi:hypothetical protein [Bradyrhizobium erythrophlei]|uniref:Uncharacterized protein n=1 Tax=Bradyrhizobium erythrophlei TaxID=1437360 RepID=A0A1M7UY18_9BRAD|nr:hypothetical protein [Bradyrhizobium erythrophlei]SHN87854.1 hypothetical protein SAMN05444170_7408 [Bradyrhizobium erythrophlei]